MDRLAVTAGFFFIFIFCSTTSIALGVVDNTDITGRDQSRTFPDPETQFPRTIRLPTAEKPEYERAPVEKIPESDDTAAVVSSTETGMESVPLTIVSFRPINRRFRSSGRAMIPFQRRHPCRHHHQQLGKPWGPGFRGREVSYGDDMLVSDFKGVGPDPMFRGGVRQIPARWVRFHPEGTGGERMRWAHLRKDEKREEEEEEKHEEEEEHHHHHHHHHHENEKREEEEEEHHHHHHLHHHHEKNWFMGKVRKFLNPF